MLVGAKDVMELQVMVMVLQQHLCINFDQEILMKVCSSSG